MYNICCDEMISLELLFIKISCLALLHFTNECCVTISNEILLSN